MDEHQDKLNHLHGGEVPFPPKISVKRIIEQYCNGAKIVWNSLLEGWSTCSQEVVEVHHHVHSGVQEGSKATLTSSDKPNMVQMIEINGRSSHLICHLGPHQQRRGRVPWWITWRGDRWVNFFRATKNIESARSINWKKTLVLSMTIKCEIVWALSLTNWWWVGMVWWIPVCFLLVFGLGLELDNSLPLRSSTTMRGWGPSWPGDLCHNPQVGRPSCTLLSCRNPSPGGKCPVIYKFSLWKLYL